MTGLALWGGVECTVCRMGDQVRDQLQLTGHDAAIDDLDTFATLGLEAIRYPVLWERTERRPGQWDWTWADARLARLDRLGIRPIVGLVHHGSGPAWTHLLDPEFARGLATHAGQVARRYPWVRDWTPVNEPLTTARFSALYGHWYPHRQDEASFWTALLIQVEATVLAMKEIRQVTPGARLIQTDDLGLCSGTEPCRSQIAFENDRRWMTWDLLAGRVDRKHPLWSRLVGFGLQGRLQALIEGPCPADVIGINHYLTSDRFLDHRLDRYPPHVHGGNGQLAYADVETVRVLPPLDPAWHERISEALDRYDRPVAVTECHLGGAMSDQLAWLHDCWAAANALRAAGRDVEAVTLWSLAGSVDWDSLLTLDRGHNEAGVFRRLDGQLVDTPLSRLARRLGGSPAARRADKPGWWAHPERVLYPLSRVA